MIGLATFAASTAASLASFDARADVLFNLSTGTCQSTAGTEAFAVDEELQITDAAQRACDLSNGHLTAGSCTTPRLSPRPYEFSKYLYRIPCNSMDDEGQAAISTDVPVPIVILLHGGGGGPGVYVDFMSKNTDLFDEDVVVVSLNSETYEEGDLPRRSGWQFPGAGPLTVEHQAAYVDVVRLERLIETLKSVPALAGSPVVLAAFSFGTHVADQMVCTRSDMIDRVFNITADAFRPEQLGSFRSPSSANFLRDGCGSGREPGYLSLTGRAASTVYGTRVAATGALYNPSVHGAGAATEADDHPVHYHRYFGLGDDNIAFDPSHIGMAETARLLKALNGFGPDGSPTKTRFIPGGLTDTFEGDGLVTTLTQDQDSLITSVDGDDLVVTEYRWEAPGRRVVFGKAHPRATDTLSGGIRFTVFNWGTTAGDPVSSRPEEGTRANCGAPLETVFPFTDQSQGQVLPGAVPWIPYDPLTWIPYEKGGPEDCHSIAEEYGLHQWWDGTGISQRDLKATDLILEALGP